MYPPTISTSNQVSRRISNPTVPPPPVVTPPKPRQLPNKPVEQVYDYRNCVVSKSYKGLLLVTDESTGGINTSNIIVDSKESYSYQIDDLDPWITKPESPLATSKPSEPPKPPE